MTKIGYDAKRIVRNATGLGNYCRTLVTDMDACVGDRCELLLYAPDRGHDHLRERVSTSGHLRFVYPHGGDGQKGGLWHRITADRWRSHGIVDDLKRDQVALFHGLSGELPKGLRRAGIPSVVTIHDLIFLRHPEYYPPIDRRLYKWKFHRTCKEADHIIAISECTKRDIMHYGGVEEERISVIYQSCGNHFAQPVAQSLADEVRSLYRLPARYMVCVGSVEERKNVALAVKALPSLPDTLSLVIVGRHTPYADYVSQLAARMNLQHRVLLLHDVPFAHLSAIYHQAEVCVYPSRYEGFGIPVVEAIQSGLPVVACTGSCLEEAGGPDCLYVDPDDVEAMAQAVSTLIDNTEERQRRVKASREYIRRFEGADVARQVWQVYQRLVPELKQIIP